MRNFRTSLESKISGSLEHTTYQVDSTKQTDFRGGAWRSRDQSQGSNNVGSPSWDRFLLFLKIFLYKFYTKLKPNLF